MRNPVLEKLRKMREQNDNKEVKEEKKEEPKEVDLKSQAEDKASGQSDMFEGSKKKETEKKEDPKEEKKDIPKEEPKEEKPKEEKDEKKVEKPKSTKKTKEAEVADSGQLDKILSVLEEIRDVLKGKQIFGKNAQINTKVTEKESGKDVSEESSEDSLGICKCDGHPATVALGLGRTFNLGNFKSIKVDVHASIPSNVDDMDAQFEKVSEFVKAKFTEKTQKIKDAK